MKVADRLDAIEKELVEMKTQLSAGKSPRVVKLKGRLKGLAVERAGLEEARKSLFKNASS